MGMRKRRHRAKPEEATEKDVETYLKDLCNDNGLLCLKLATIGVRGFPDRTILGPNRLIFFVELKREKGKHKKLQAFVSDALKRLGFNVYLVRTHDEAARCVADEIRAAPVAVRGD